MEEEVIIDILSYFSVSLSQNMFWAFNCQRPSLRQGLAQGWGGYSDIFKRHFLAQNCILDFQKNDNVLVLRFGGCFLGSSQNWAIFRGHFYAYLGSFLKLQNGGYFLGWLKFQIFFGGA